MADRSEGMAPKGAGLDYTQMRRVAAALTLAKVGAAEWVCKVCINYAHSPLQHLYKRPTAMTGGERWTNYTLSPTTTERQMTVIVSGANYEQ